MFQALHWRLLISYLGVMVAILGTFTLAVYQFVAYNLYQETDRQMLSLANAAAHHNGVLIPVAQHRNAQHPDDEQCENRADEATEQQIADVLAEQGFKRIERRSAEEFNRAALPLFNQ